MKKNIAPFAQFLRNNLKKKFFKEISIRLKLETIDTRRAKYLNEFPGELIR